MPYPTGKTEDFGVDIARGWGQRRSVARDYIYDSPVLIGRHRIGPDLANIGTRLDPNDLHKHIYRPPHGSNMPAYPYLYKVQKIRGGSSKHAIAFKKYEYGAPDEGYEVVPKPSANDLVNYLTGLRQDYELPGEDFTQRTSPITETITVMILMSKMKDPRWILKSFQRVRNCTTRQAPA